MLIDTLNPKKMYAHWFFPFCEEVFLFVHTSIVVSILFLLITKSKHF